MRKVLAVLAIFLGACGGNGGGVETTPEPLQHVPEISNLTLSPDSALYMEGDGSIQVTAEFSYTDIGQDIETFYVRLSGGQSVPMSVAALVDGVSGTLTTEFAVPTADKNGCTVEVWLVDRAGQSSNHLVVAFSVSEHPPEITSVILSPDSAHYMEGDGSVVVTAEISFSDAGRDIETLWARMPDGTTIDFDLDIAEATGSFTRDFTMSTQRVGELAVEFWLVDRTLNESALHFANFAFVFDSARSDWTSRLEVPQPLYDVVWDGQVFIAVGHAGAIWTSADGLVWEAQTSGTSRDLYAVAAYGGDIFAVSGATVLMSTDHGETWNLRSQPGYILLTAVAVNVSRIAAIGVDASFVAKIAKSEDRGDTWQVDDFVAWASDLIYQNEIFLATTGDSVVLSSDGELWSETLVDERDTLGWLWVAIHDGDQFFVAGEEGTVLSSADGFNWTRIPTPNANVDYRSAARDGSRLLLAGGVSYEDWEEGVYYPFGLSTADGGATWEVFDIEAGFQSNSMAWGNGRFVSVGWMLDSDRGAIYTTE
jgi:predicted regulator of Ras-like GTPase activity (Roadblock/LC7/MglB family)